MASSIGIKIANGEFYHIVEENSHAKKRLILTTVHDKQKSVQIDLYKSFTRTMADAAYIGSLVMDNIKPRPRGEPSIELVISSAQNGDITADSVDLDSKSGGRQTMSVSLTSMDDDTMEADIPDFELDDSQSTGAGQYERAAQIYKEEKKGFPWLVVILAALVLTAIGLVIWLYFFQGKDKPETAPPPAVVQTSQPAQTQALQQVQPEQTQAALTQQPAAQTQQPAITPAAQTPVIQAPTRAPESSTASRARRLAPVASYNVPSVIPREGVPYRIRYGDTLWDIAEAFYRNPWLYPRIARFNNIRNPDHIISGTTIIVPPRN